MPVNILKNPISLPVADAAVVPVYLEETGLFAHKAGRATMVEKSAAGKGVIRVTCPETFRVEAFRRGYASCVRLAKAEGWHSLTMPLLVPREPADHYKAALHLAVNALGDAIGEAPIQAYLVVAEPERIGISPTLRQRLAQYIQRSAEERAMGSAAICEEACAVKWKEASPVQSQAKMVMPMPAMAAQRPSVAKKSKLEDMLKQVDAGFSETLLRLIDESGKKDSEIYNKANVSRQHFSKIRNNPDYRPTKPTAIAFAIALKLDLQQTKDLIGRAGYALTRSSVFDLIIMYFIENKNYDLYEINEALFEFDQNLLGA